MFRVYLFERLFRVWLASGLLFVGFRLFSVHWGFRFLGFSRLSLISFFWGLGFEVWRFENWEIFRFKQCWIFSKLYGF